MRTTSGKAEPRLPLSGRGVRPIVLAEGAVNETNPRYCRNPVVSTTAVEDDLFLVEPEGQDVYYLDAITSGIWRLLEEATIQRICRARSSLRPSWKASQKTPP